MKHIYALTILALMAVGVTACNNGGGSSTAAGVVATTPTTTPNACNVNWGGYNNPYSANSQYFCQNNAYNGSAITWPAYGQWSWPQQWTPTGNNCGCPSGSISVFSPSFGVACAPNVYAQAYSIVTFNYNWLSGPPQNSIPLNMPQMTYAGSAQNSCLNQTAQGCDTRYNLCPASTVCQAIAGGSTIGLCVRGP